MTRRLCVLDVESTLITSDITEFLADLADARDEVASAAEAHRRGDLDYVESWTRQVAALKGLPEVAFDKALARVRLTPGAQNLVETLHGRGWIIGLVSGGFGEIVGPLAARLGITLYRANRLESVNGYLTGQPSGPVIDRAAKAQALREFAEAEGVAIGDTVAIGGGADDLDLMKTAGLALAFNAPPSVQDAADVAVTSTRLDAVLEALADGALKG